MIYIKNVAWATSALVSAIFCGKPYQTVSGRAFNTKWQEPIDFVFGKDHCARAYMRWWRIWQAIYVGRK